MRTRLLAASVVALALGAGLIVLQRWVAETRTAAIILVAAWFAIVAMLALYAARRRPELRLPLLGTLGVIALVSAVVGWWTGFRDHRVDEMVAMAKAEASPTERTAGLAGRATREHEESNAPVELVSGRFEGADGHAGTGRATVVREPSGDRKLTFTEFDVDPGPGVEVYLTRDATDVSDRIELGALKGNVGDQQYEIPASADLRAYDTVMLYCTPFTVRIATAPLA